MGDPPVVPMDQGTISSPKGSPVLNYKAALAQGNKSGASSSSSTGPKKTFGVLLKRTPGVNLEEALHAVAKVIDPKKIVYADFLSAANFGVWFDSEETANEFMRQDTVEIRGETSKLHRYANPIRKVILRGVPPFISDEILLKALEKYGEARSAIIHQKVYGLSDKYAHIRSFTRSVEISMKGKDLIPPKIKVTCEGVEYAILTQVGGRKCFKCQKPGHVSKDCPTKNIQADGAQVAKGKNKNKNKKPTTSGTKVDDPESMAVDDEGDDVGIANGASDNEVFVVPRNKPPKAKKLKRIGTVPTQSGDDTESDTEPTRKISTRSQSQSSTGSGSSKNVLQKGPASWGHDHWKKSESFKAYESITLDRLYAFLQCLRSEDSSVEFDNFEKQALLATRDVREMYELLFEVQQSLGTPHRDTKDKISSVLSLLGDLADMKDTDKDEIFNTIDYTFRKSEMNYFQKVNTYSISQMNKFRNFFFN